MIGVNPRNAQVAEALTAMGIEPGHPSRLRTVVDETLAGHPVVWTAAGTADSVMPLTFPQLLVVTGGQEIQVR